MRIVILSEGIRSKSPLEAETLKSEGRNFSRSDVRVIQREGTVLLDHH